MKTWLDVFVRRYAALVYRALAPSEGALRRLLESGDVDFVDGANRVADPLFAAFLKTERF